MSTILITDTLFVTEGSPEEVLLTDAGYRVDHLEEVQASEEILIERIRGKAGYLLGGIETVTERVIDAADDLRAIAFTGSGFAEFIPAWQLATSRGIAISAARGANADAVAEWALASALSLVRNLPALSGLGGPSFYIARDFASLTMGIVGFGAVGHALAQRASALGITVLATAPSSAGDAVTSGVTHIVDVDELLERVDIVSVHVSKGRGVGVLGADQIASLKPGTVVINAAFREAVDNDALIERVRTGAIRAAVDYPLETKDLPLGSLIASNAQTAFNTAETNARVSRRAAASLLNLLQTGDDLDLVNPEYRSHR